MLRFTAVTTPLADIIRRDIQTHGPMGLGRYMALCLSHPVHGYYMTRDPFGVDGDFTTAPEISQLFGELIGAWVVDLWIKTGQNSPFRIIEFGPGRGTLMSDMLRVTRSVPGFHEAVHVHLIEMSPILRERQRQALDGYRVSWHDHLDQVPEDGQIVIIGNEFLDALPARQYIKTKETWMERVVRVDEKGEFSLAQAPADPAMQVLFPRTLVYPHENACIEISPILNQILKCAYNRMQKQKGVALFIDYGPMHTSWGQTIQAVQKHRMVSIFHEPGESDITAHVNFETVGTIALENGLVVHGPTTQGDFLNSLGIRQRQAILNKNATDRQIEEIENSINRLVSYDQMGQLFKVIAVSADPDVKLEGFA